MKVAKANRPLGSTYNRIYGAWLSANGFDGITNQERYRAILCVEHCDAIEAWRASFTDERRRAWNHPGAVWSHWRKAVNAEQNRAASAGFAERPQRLHVVKGAISHKGARAIHWPQDAIRRAAHAMRDARSNDLYILARVALGAAIRDEIDLLDLLPAPTRAPAKPAPIEAVALT